MHFRPHVRPCPGSFWRARCYRYAGHQRLLHVRSDDNEWYSHGRAGGKACPAATFSQVNFGVKMWFGSGQQLFSKQYLFMPMCGLCGKTWTRGRSQANTEALYSSSDVSQVIYKAVHAVPRNLKQGE